jgi:hypothetical protein
VNVYQMGLLYLESVKSDSSCFGMKMPRVCENVGIAQCEVTRQQCDNSKETPTRGHNRVLPVNSTRPLDVCRARRCVLLVRWCGGAARRPTLLLQVEVRKVQERLRIEELAVVSGEEESGRAMVMLLGVVGGVRSWATLEESTGRTPVRRLPKRRPNRPVDSSTAADSTCG